MESHFFLLPSKNVDLKLLEKAHEAFLLNFRNMHTIFSSIGSLWIGPCTKSIFVSFKENRLKIKAVVVCRFS